MAEDSWVQIDNYLAERARLSFRDHEYVTESTAIDTRAVPEIEIDSWTRRFLTVGLHPETHAVNPSNCGPEPHASQLSLYLADYERDRYIDAKQPVAVDLGKALDEFDRLSDTRGFIGFRRNDGAVLQFIWNHDQTLSADLPILGRRASLVRRGTREELGALIERIANGAPTRELPDFHLESHAKATGPFQTAPGDNLSTKLAILTREPVRASRKFLEGWKGTDYVSSAFRQGRLPWSMPLRQPAGGKVGSDGEGRRGIQGAGH